MTSYTKYHKLYNESKSTKKFTMELNELERFGLNEYAKFKNKKLKELLLDCLEKAMFTDKDYVKSLGTAGSAIKSIKQLYEAEQKRLANEQKTKEKGARRQELARLRKVEKARAKEIQAKILNLKSRVKASKEVEIPVTAKKTEDKKPPLKNHRMKFLTGITQAKPKEAPRFEKQVIVKTQPVKEPPKQMSILEEVEKLTEKEKVKLGQSKKPDIKLKNSKQGKSDDKLEFGPGSKGVSNSMGKPKKIKRVTKKSKPKNNKK